MAIILTLQTAEMQEGLLAVKVLSHAHEQEEFVKEKATPGAAQESSNDQFQTLEEQLRYNLREVCPVQEIDGKAGTWNVELAPEREISQEVKSLAQVPGKLNGNITQMPEYGAICDHEGRLEKQRMSLNLSPVFYVSCQWAVLKALFLDDTCTSITWVVCLNCSFLSPTPESVCEAEPENLYLISILVVHTHKIPREAGRGAGRSALKHGRSSGIMCFADKVFPFP
ncbi:hypothetical protein H8959_010543 [Pygathrix nigripes]